MEGHQPIEGGEGQGDGEERQGGSPQAALAGGQSKVLDLVLPGGPSIEQRAHRNPDSEVHRGPGQEERDIEIGLLVFEQLDRLLGQVGGGAYPNEKVLHPDGDRQEQGSENNHREGHDFQHPAEQHRPLRIGGVKYGEEKKGADRQAEPVCKANQIRKQSLLRVGDEAQSGKQQAEDTQRQTGR